MKIEFLKIAIESKLLTMQAVCDAIGMPKGTFNTLYHNDKFKDEHFEQIREAVNTLSAEKLSVAVDVCTLSMGRKSAIGILELEAERNGVTIQHSEHSTELCTKLLAKHGKNTFSISVYKQKVMLCAVPSGLIIGIFRYNELNEVIENIINI